MSRKRKPIQMVYPFDAREVTMLVRGQPVTAILKSDGAMLKLGWDGTTHDPATGPVITVERTRKGWTVFVRPFDHTDSGRIKIEVSGSVDSRPSVTLAGVEAHVNKLYDTEKDPWDIDQDEEDAR